jgi:hypothetical protein
MIQLVSAWYTKTTIVLPTYTRAAMDAGQGQGRVYPTAASRAAGSPGQRQPAVAGMECALSSAYICMPGSRRAVQGPGWAYSA